MTNSDAASRFDRIYDSTNRAALAQITAKCGNTADISDIFQDVYLELYRVLLKRGADYITNEKAFVSRIAKRKIAKYYSLMDRLKILTQVNVIDKDGEEYELADEAFMTEDFAANNDVIESAKRFIAEKPQETQKVFFLFYDAGLSIPEVADALSMSQSGVKNRLYRTINELRGFLS